MRYNIDKILSRYETLRTFQLKTLNESKIRNKNFKYYKNIDSAISNVVITDGILVCGTPVVVNLQQNLQCFSLF